MICVPFSIAVTFVCFSQNQNKTGIGIDSIGYKKLKQTGGFQIKGWHIQFSKGKELMFLIKKSLAPN